jgi:peptide/nickel transport system substrate-binding protein
MNDVLRFVCMLAAFALSTSVVSAPVRAAAHSTVRYAFVGEPTSLNPLFLNGASFVMIDELAFEPLLRLAPGNRLVPALALEEPTIRNGGISADGRRVTFHLRRGTTWADGSPVTSADVRFGVEQLLNPANDVASRTGYDLVRAMRTPDKWTIEFDFASYDPEAISGLNFITPLPQHLLSGLHDLNRSPYNALPVGNGPYNVVEWKRGDVIRLVANPRYWRGRPAVSEIDLKIVPSSSTAMLQLGTHEVDLTYVTPSMVPQLPAGPIARRIAPTIAWGELAFNFSQPALADRRVRRAIELAIDREKIATVTGHGLEKTDHVLQPLFQWALDPKIDPPRYNVALANRLFDEAGWKVDPEGIRRKGSASLQFTLVYAAGGNGVLPATIASELEAVHVRVEQKAVQTPILYETAKGGGVLAGGKFDLALLSLQTEPGPGVSWLFGCDQRAPKGFNDWQYCNTRLDADSKDAKTTFDRSRQLRAFSAAQRQLIDDVAFVPLFRLDDMYAYADWLHGINPSVYGPFWNVYAWSISGS